MKVLFAIATGLMFGMGVFQILRRDLVKAAMGFFTLFTAVNLFMLAAGVFDGERPAYRASSEQAAQGAGQPSDPVVQALLLTAIVISLGSYVLLLGMVELSASRFRSVDSDDLDELAG